MSNYPPGVHRLPDDEFYPCDNCNALNMHDEYVDCPSCNDQNVCEKCMYCHSCSQYVADMEEGE
jgi:hypothetical protein